MRPHRPRPSTLVVIPAHNEEMAVGSVISSIQTALPTVDLIVVDDGSLDRTAEIVRGCGVRLIRHPINLGYGAAVQTGLRYALNRGYEYAVLMDADGQHEHEDIPILLEALAHGQADVAIGSRLLGKTRDYRISLPRVFGMEMLSLLTTLFTGKGIRDTTSGFQAIRRGAMGYLARTYPSHFPDADVIICLKLNGFVVTEVKVRFRARATGKSMFTLLKILYYPMKASLAILAVLMRRLFDGKGKG